MKKTLSMLLAIAMILSVFAVPVMAENSDELAKLNKTQYTNIPLDSGANCHIFEPQGQTVEGISDPTSALYTSGTRDYINDYMQTYWYDSSATMGIDSTDSDKYTWEHYPIYYRTEKSFSTSCLTLDENSCWTVPYLCADGETVKELTYKIDTSENIIKLVGAWNSTYQKLTEKAKEAYSEKNKALRNATLDIENENFKNIYILASKGYWQNGTVAPQYFTADVYYEGEETPVNVQLGIKKANIAETDAELASVTSVLNKIEKLKNPEATTYTNSSSYAKYCYASGSTWYSYEIPCDVSKKVDKVKFNVSLGNCNILILSALGEKGSIKDLIDAVETTEVDASNYESQFEVYTKIKAEIESAELDLQTADENLYAKYSALENNIKAYEDILFAYGENKSWLEFEGNSKLFVNASSEDYTNRATLTGFLPGLDYAGTHDNPTGDFETDRTSIRTNADFLAVFQYSLDTGATNANSSQSGVVEFTTGADGKIYWNINGVDYPVKPTEKVIKVVAGPVTTKLESSTVLDAETKAEHVKKYSTLTNFTYDVKDGYYKSLGFLAGIAQQASTSRKVNVTFVYGDDTTSEETITVTGTKTQSLTRAQGGVFFHRMSTAALGDHWSSDWHTFAPYTVNPNPDKLLKEIKFTPVVETSSSYRYPIYILSAWGEGKAVEILMTELSDMNITDAESAIKVKAKLEAIDAALANIKQPLKEEHQVIYNEKSAQVAAYEKVIEAEKEREKLDKNEFKDIPFGDAANSHVFEVYGTTIEGIDDPTSELYTSGSKDYVFDYAQNYWYDANKQNKLGVDSTDGDLYTWTHKPVYYKKTSTHSQSYIPLDENNNWTVPYVDGEEIRYLTYTLKPDQKAISLAGGFLAGYQQLTEKATEKYVAKQANMRKAVIDVENDNYNSLYMLLTTGLSGTGTAPENFTAEIYYEGEQETKIIELGLLRNNISTTEDSITAKFNAISGIDNDRIWDYNSSMGYASSFGWYTYEIPCDLTKKVDKIVLRISAYNKFVTIASMLGEKPSIKDVLAKVETTEITPVTYRAQKEKLGMIEAIAEKNNLNLELAGGEEFEKYNSLKTNIEAYEEIKHTLNPTATLETSFYKNETPYVKVNIFNPSEAAGKLYTLIFSYLDAEGNYLGADIKPSLTLAEESYSYTHKAEKTFENTKKVKAFVWEGFANVKPIAKTSEAEETNAFKVLSIGNSFSQGVHTYLAEFAKDAGYEKIICGNLYIGGCSTDKHYSNIINNKAEYEFHVWELKDGKIVKNEDVTPSSTMLEGIKFTDWDIITIQQNCANSGIADKYTRLDAILDYVYENKTNNNAKIGWHMTWAARENSSVLAEFYAGKDQMGMYEDIVATIKSTVEPNSKIDFIVPAGTAVQNARAVYGDTFNSDEKHLNAKGNTIACLTWLATITGNNLENITYMPDSKTTAEEMAAYKKAALDAVKNPYQVTK